MGINDAINHAFSLLKTGPSPATTTPEGAAKKWARVFDGELDWYNGEQDLESDEQDSDTNTDESEDPCCTEAKEAMASHWELMDHHWNEPNDVTDHDKTRANIMNMECDELQEWLDGEIRDELEHNNDNHWTGFLESLRAIQDQWDACSSESFSDMKYAGEPIDISHRFLKSQMSDVHIGFQEDPKREIERLRHQGISREEAMAMYQQYLDSLEQGA